MRDRPTASLASPVNNSTVSASSLASLASTTPLEFTLSDPGLGTFGQSPFGSGALVQIDMGGQQLSNLTFGTPTAVPGFPNTYSMTVGGFPTSCPNGAGSCVVTVEFLPGAFQDSNGNKSLGSIQQFFVVEPSTTTAAPIAVISSPSTTQAIAAENLNAAGYIDVTYEALGASPLCDQGALASPAQTCANSSTVPALEAGSTIQGQTGNVYAPFTLTGSGLANIALASDEQPQLASAPEEVSSTSSTATFRYYFEQASSTATDGLFQAGNVTLSFAAGAFETQDGTANTAGLEQLITVQDPPMFTSSASVSLGPLTLQGPSFGLEDIGFKGGQLVLTVGIGVNQASLGFGGSGGSGGQSSSGVTANLTGILGTFQLKVNVLGLLSGNFSVNPGTFTLSVKTLTVNVPNVVNVNAAGIEISYDPNGGSTQQLVVVQSATIFFPTFKVLAQICPYNTSTNQAMCTQQTGSMGGTSSTTISTTPAGLQTCPAKSTTCIPGLTIYEDGFVFGAATVQLTSTVTLGPLSVTGLTIGVQDFSMKFGSSGCTGGASVCVSGTIIFGATGASLTAGPVSATLTPAPGSKTGLAIQLSLTFTSSGGVSNFGFNVGQLTIKLGTFVSLTATNVTLNTDAIGTSNPLLTFGGPLSATVNIGSLSLTGTAQGFTITGNGQFQTSSTGFSISLSIGGANGSSFQWPSWLPITINSIGIDWPNGLSNPDKFVITLSAGVNSIAGLSGLQISGAISNIQIDPSLLAQGEFPIVGIGALAVTVQGNLFGGQLDAGLVGGILELDANDNIIPAGSNTAVAQRIPYFAIEGGFVFAGLSGFTIRFGLSSLGPLQAFIDVEIPSGILLDPDTGLTLNDFSAGIEFNQTVSNICGGSAPATPMSLSSCTMPSATSGTAAQWLLQLQQQIVAQAKSGTTWATAFSQPMLILGSATIYSIYTSQQLFNAKVSLAFSTDGQILIEGQLNFADNQLSLGAYLYANLTQISSGTLNIMFLANIPQQIQIVQIYGQLQMGFENDAGQAIVYDVTGQTPAASTQLPSVPTASLAAPVNGQTLSQADVNGEGWVDVTYPSFGGEPVDPTSVENASQALLLTDANNDTLAVAGQPVLINASTNTFRYFFSGYTQPLAGHTNTVNVTFEGGWDNTAGVPWCAAGSTTCAPNANPTAATPVFGTWLDATLASPAGDSVQSTPTSSEITLSGGGVGSVVPYTGTAPVVQVGADTYRFLYTGAFGTGQVNVAFNSAATGASTRSTAAGMSSRASPRAAASR